MAENALTQPDPDLAMTDELLDVERFEVVPDFEHNR